MIIVGGFSAIAEKHVRSRAATIDIRSLVAAG